jgi:hypothetical protein
MRSIGGWNDDMLGCGVGEMFLVDVWEAISCKYSDVKVVRQLRCGRPSPQSSSLYRYLRSIAPLSTLGLLVRRHARNHRPSRLPCTEHRATWSQGHPWVDEYSEVITELARSA